MDDWPQCKVDEVVCTDNGVVENREEKSETSRHRGQEEMFE